MNKLECTKSKEELYEQIIKLILSERSYLLYKDNLYRYLKGKKPGITQKTYKDELIQTLGEILTPDNLEIADKDLGITLYLCDLMKLFGLSYRKIKRIIDNESIPHGYRDVNCEFKGKANTFTLESICRIYEILNNEHIAAPAINTERKGETVAQ